MKYKIKNILTGLKNLWKWRKVIYSDRDWDHWHILEILKTKLKFQAEHFIKDGVTESAGKHAKQMLECVDLVDKVQTEYYIDLAINGLVDEGWTDEMFNEVAKKQDEARKRLFKLLEKNIEHWWD